MAEQKRPQDFAETLKKALEALENYQRTIAPSEQYIPVNQLGNLVRAERKKQKVTKDTLSKLSGVSVGTINAIEAGKDTPSLANIQKVLHALGKKIWLK